MKIEIHLVCGRYMTVDTRYSQFAISGDEVYELHTVAGKNMKIIGDYVGKIVHTY